MNRSFSKIRHIQEANQRLEQRVLNEQWETKDLNKNKSVYTVEDIKRNLLKSGFKSQPSTLSDGWRLVKGNYEVEDIGWGIKFFDKSNGQFLQVYKSNNYVDPTQEVGVSYVKRDPKTGKQLGSPKNKKISGDNIITLVDYLRMGNVDLFDFMEKTY